jgi:hypothetical protein
VDGLKGGFVLQVRRLAYFLQKVYFAEGDKPSAALEKAHFLLSFRAEPRKDNKKWVSYLHRTAQPSTLASFRTWGIQQELVV